MVSSPTHAEDPPPHDEIVPATERFAAHVGPEARRRPEASFARAVAATASAMGGVALAALGLDVVLRGGHRGAAALLFVGYAVAGIVLSASPRPPVRTAGVVAVAVAIPGAAGLVTLEVDGVSAGAITSALAVSTVVWGLAYVTGPTRGHGVLLGATLVGAWLTVVTRLDVLAVVDQGAFGVRPDVTAPAAASLAIGVASMWGGAVLIRAGLGGAGSVCWSVGLVVVGAGITLAAADHSRVTVGVLAVISGLAIGATAHRLRRSFSTRAGGASLVLGLGLVATAGYDGDVTGPAVVALGLAVGVVAAVTRLAPRFDEPDNRPGE
ncbi:MAG TPA: hypothetical protein VI916_08685 [Acidimicrobiia bacterium]|nr:hypothetical protein [Acidimicrobiia bacterium]